VVSGKLAYSPAEAFHLRHAPDLLSPAAARHRAAVGAALMAKLEDAIKGGESAVIFRADRQAADAGDLTPVGAQRGRALPAVGGTRR
jgi:hypothetical protein